jgi:hypothetical protein
MADIHNEMAGACHTQIIKWLTPKKWLTQKWLRQKMVDTEMEWLTHKCNG